MMDQIELNIAIIKTILVMLAAVIVMALVFFLAAGCLGISRAWIYFGAVLVNYLVTIVILYKYNPELIIHRLKRKKDAKLWDKILMRVINLIGIIGLFWVAGLDIRNGWSHPSSQLAVLGYILWIISNIVFIWAMAVNKFFEPTVRIQEDRNHQVVTTGPYQIVRHPGYMAGILFYVGIPLILGSVYAFIPAAIAFILLVIRTALEDKTLHDELTGYPEYAKKIKFKLILEIW